MKRDRNSNWLNKKNESCVKSIFWGYIWFRINIPCEPCVRWRKLRFFLIIFFLFFWLVGLIFYCLLSNFFFLVFAQNFYGSNFNMCKIKNARVFVFFFFLVSNLSGHFQEPMVKKRSSIFYMHWSQIYTIHWKIKSFKKKK